MEESFLLVLDEISRLLSDAYEKAGVIDDEHALAQVDLKDGSAIVLDYLHHNEAGVAFDQLMYMINEAQLSLSPVTVRSTGLAIPSAKSRSKMPMTEPVPTNCWRVCSVFAA